MFSELRQWHKPDMISYSAILAQAQGHMVAADSREDERKAKGGCRQPYTKQKYPECPSKALRPAHLHSLDSL